MRTIQKYNLEIKDVQYISVPKNHKLLCCQMQNGILRIWAEVKIGMDEDYHRKIYIFGTGNEIIEGLIYLGTVQDKHFVWHIYAS